MIALNTKRRRVHLLVAISFQVSGQEYSEWFSGLACGLVWCNDVMSHH